MIRPHLTSSFSRCLTLAVLAASPYLSPATAMSAPSAQGSPPGVLFCVADGTDPAIISACPCGNTGAAGRGCQNSQATGGGLLNSAGTTSPDTVVLTATGMVPSSMCIFLGGDALFGGGDPFADGIKCVAGHQIRIGTKSAPSGSASYPQVGDVSISQKSAQLGWPISNGATRWYQVYYRVPVSTFCPWNNFNFTSGQRITW